MKNYWERNVIPKWRKSKVAAALPETQPSKEVAKTALDLVNTKSSFEHELAGWKRERSFGVAADLLNFGHIEEFASLLEEPASYILQTEGELPVNLQYIANKILNKDTSDVVIVSPAGVEVGTVHSEISRLKKRLNLNPSDGISQVDIARLYASLGQREKANKAIVIATSVYPDHRFILRSSIRYWIHEGDPEKGLALLKKTQRTSQDPWLLASELAVESVLKRSPKRWKLAKEMVSSKKFSDEHISELASATASIHLLDGQIKDAKKMFNIALLKPNDNAIAQAVWAAQFFGLQIRSKEEWFEGEFSSEVNYYKKQAELDFEGSIDAAMEWFSTEPFSLRPLRAATYAACVIDKYEDAEKFARMGLALDKYDLELGNNLVYALAGQGKMGEVLEKLQEVYHNERALLGQTGYHTIANIGMMHYRAGNFEEGEKLYRHCLKMLQKDEYSEARGLAMVTLAREATLANAQNAEKLLAEATDVVKQSNSKGGLRMLANLMQTELKLERTAYQVPEWLHEKASNTLIVGKIDPFKINK